MSFQETLSTLPPVDHLARLELRRDPAGPVVAVIENRPGQAGSLRVYHAVAGESGVLDAAAAERALALYGEYTEEARQRPGSHPNIDRLFEIIANGECLHIQSVEAPQDGSKQQ